MILGKLVTYSYILQKYTVIFTINYSISLSKLIQSP